MSYNKILIHVMFAPLFLSLSETNHPKSPEEPLPLCTGSVIPINFAALMYYIKPLK